MFKNIDVLPYTYDIVKCFFPDRDDIGETPNNPNAYTDFHYCLVLGTFEEKHEIMVVYGTSLENKKIYKNDFVFYDDMRKVVNLKHETKYIFMPNSLAILPYNTKFFAPGIIGSCDENIVKSIEAFLMNYEIEDLIDDLIVSEYNMLPRSWWGFGRYIIP